MSDIKIKIGKAIDVPTKAALKIRKGLNGNIMIFDHEDIDIIITGANKILTLPKDIMNERVYSAQNKMFKFLVRKGVIFPESIRAGNVYGSMEAKIMDASEDLSMNPVDFAILAVARWIEEERPFFMYHQASEIQDIKRLTEPDEEESTELGEVPHAATKGSTFLAPGLTNRTQRPY